MATQRYQILMECCKNFSLIEVERSSIDDSMSTTEYFTLSVVTVRTDLR